MKLSICGTGSKKTWQPAECGSRIMINPEKNQERFK